MPPDAFAKTIEQIIAENKLPVMATHVGWGKGAEELLIGIDKDGYPVFQGSDGEYSVYKYSEGNWKVFVKPKEMMKVWKWEFWDVTGYRRRTDRRYATKEDVQKALGNGYEIICKDESSMKEVEK